MVARKGISNVVCYDLLAQSKYRELLQYVPVVSRDKNNLKSKSDFSDSDKLRKYIDYPFLKDD